MFEVDFVEFFFVECEVGLCGDVVDLLVVECIVFIVIVGEVVYLFGCVCVRCCLVDGGVMFECVGGEVLFCVEIE